MTNVIELSKRLINIPSITPKGNACIDVLVSLLQPLGFTIEKFNYGDATNLWARYGEASPLLCLLGHVDVVPIGPREKWQHDPFAAVIENDMLYGRGASDMKTGVAAMITAATAFVQQKPHFNGSIAFLITTAEEDMHELGVPNVVEILKKRNEKIDYCITGEPSSQTITGDTIRNGRRGSLGAKLTVHGKQGHVAFPHLADNPLHKAFAAFDELTRIEWDRGNDDFPPTSFQFTNLHSGTGANNIIPGDVVCHFNFRFSPEVSAETLTKKTTTVLEKHALNYDVEWNLSGFPFFTAKDRLTTIASNAVQTLTGTTPQFSTGGGTSDARFIAPLGAQVIELGVTNKTAHQIDECETIENIRLLPRIYLHILHQLFNHRHI